MLYVIGIYGDTVTNGQTGKKEETSAAYCKALSVKWQGKTRESRSLRPRIDFSIAEKEVDMFTRRQSARQQTLQCGELSHN